jgi:ligand-binding SRPBCC domain-containing protein
MSGWRLERRQVVPRPVGEVFGFFADPDNLARITPPWLAFRLVAYEPPGGGRIELSPAQPDAAAPRITMAEGVRLHYTIRPLGISQRWTSVITVWDPPHRFVDEQLRGPYRRWHHTHQFTATRDGTELSDVVEYDIGFGPIGSAANAVIVRRQLEAIFVYRQQRISELFNKTEET